MNSYMRTFVTLYMLYEALSFSRKVKLMQGLKKLSYHLHATLHWLQKKHQTIF